jgi:hypothetical protein
MTLPTEIEALRKNTDNCLPMQAKFNEGFNQALYEFATLWPQLEERIRREVLREAKIIVEKYEAMPPSPTSFARIRAGLTALETNHP